MIESEDNTLSYLYLCSVYIFHNDLVDVN